MNGRHHLDGGARSAVGRRGHLELRKVALVAAAAAAAAATTLGSGVAFATDNSGNCTSGDACLYFNSNFEGARVGDPGRNNYGTTYTFKSWQGGSNGAGVYTKNNAASVSNFDTNFAVHIWYNSNQAGPVQTIGAWDAANLNATLKNNNASQSWG
ncbi:peptidase inhibitor family I36 protein [Kitasatospora sp. NBC_00374]|uniref:hypothetical protein n=1 Tax=Kitasatospora sp. NBC_00374 TaxID=2975964 RepID=UPI0030E285F3